MTEISKATIVLLHKKIGLSFGQIGRILGLTAGGVYHYIEKFKIVTNYSLKLSKNSILERRSVELYRAGLNTREISEKLLTSRSTIYSWVRRNHLKPQPRGGWKLSDETKEKMSQSRKGTLHWNWKGDALNRTCANCGETFRKGNDRKNPGRGKIFCSRRCSNAYQIEERHPCWKGGHPTHRGGRYTIWARAVLTCHGKRCKKCGSRKLVEAHHIRPWAKFPELRYEISNGIPLCDKCHVNVHREKKRPWLILSA